MKTVKEIRSHLKGAKSMLRVYVLSRDYTHAASMQSYVDALRWVLAKE